MPGTDVPQSVTFLYQGQGVGLGAELLALLGEEHHINVIGSPVELAKGPPPDVVVVDVPAPDRWATCEMVRRHHHGRLLVLLGQGESGRNLPPDRNRTLLTRPFSIRQLSIALARPAPAPPTWQPAGHRRLIPPPMVRGGGVNSSPGPAGGVAAKAASGRPRSWRQRRLIRVSAISVIAALLFVGAFAVVSQGDRCGLGCTGPVGADLAAPSSTMVSLGQAGPAPTDPGGGRVDPTTNDPTANEEGQADGAGSGGTPSSATTASLSGAPTPAPDPPSAPDPTSAPNPTSAPAPTSPQPTAAPTTTRPRTSTSTSTSTTATTATTTTTTTPGP